MNSKIQLDMNHTFDFSEEWLKLEKGLNLIIENVQKRTDKTLTFRNLTSYYMYDFFFSENILQPINHKIFNNIVAYTIGSLLPKMTRK
jgi:hypothetical protein